MHSIDEVLRRRTPELLGIRGVVGTARGALPDGTPCLLVLLASAPTAEVRERVPARLDGHPVRLEVVGDLEAR